MLEKLLLSLVAGFFGLIPVLLNWLTERNKSKGLDRQLEKLSAELAFLERWSKLAEESKTDQDSAGVASRAEMQRHLNGLLAQFGTMKELWPFNTAQAAQVSLAGVCCCYTARWAVRVGRCIPPSTSFCSSLLR